MSRTRPTWPGARWWKFDFHTHTPASKDTTAWRNAEETPDAVTPEKWLLKFMEAEIDCVAITDHNSGSWIDELKSEYEKMKGDADRGAALPGFRELTLFPGVEISAAGGIHILAILDPSATKSDVDTLLGSVGYHGTKGDSDAVTTKGLVEVLRLILQQGGIPIPAHADPVKGLLECDQGTKGKVDPQTLRQALDVEGLFAVEWCSDGALPSCFGALVSRLTRVLGSDCHSFRDGSAPGKNFTWVKMARPSLEGLRLALLDGHDVSVRRSDEGSFEPNRVPAHTIAAIEIEGARYMGNGRRARLDCSPFFNAIVGGRGTGKSTIVHALRLATGRGLELPESSEPRAQFDAFRKTVKGRNGDGALRDTTVLRIEWRHEDTLVRLAWNAGDSRTTIEERCDDQWKPSASQAVNGARFPLRILSQGQIATIAGTGRRALLGIIDESAGVEPLRKALEDARRAFFSQRARLRELEGKLATLPEVERRLGEANRKLETLTQDDHTAILREYARTVSHSRDVKATFDQAREAATQIEALAEEIALDDWNRQHFTEDDADLLAWRTEVDATMERLRSSLRAEGEALRTTADAWNTDPRFKAWRTRHEAAKRAHGDLQAQLRAQGVQDPDAFARLTQERQGLERERNELERVQGDREALVVNLEAQRQLVAQRRASITAARRQFIEQVLQENPHVRVTVVPGGFDPLQVERELRDVVDVTDERFADDVLRIEDGEPRGGLAYELAEADESSKAEVLEMLKRRLIGMDARLGGHLRKYLKRRLEKPEFADHILAWYPEDDLRIEYQRDGRWVSIDHGSQGQRSAALLAFLLAFGEEPLVLDQPEDDLDNHLIYDLIVRQIRENKLRRQLLIVTHNPNVVVNGDAELVHVMDFGKGQCFVQQSGALQEEGVRQEVCRVMEGGQEPFLELKEVRFAGGKMRGPTQDVLADELAAFANSSGGVLLLGVEDTRREVVGIPVDRLDDVERVVRVACEQSIRPPLSPIIERMTLPDLASDEQPILRVAVTRSLFVHQSPGGYLHRVGSSKRPIPPDQLARLFQQRSQSRLIRFDETPVPQATWSDLEEPLWRRFAPDESSDSRKVLLEKLAMAARDDAGAWRPTVAGVLLGSHEAHAFIPGAFIQAVAYEGNSVVPEGERVYQRDAQDITGSLDRQILEACAFVRKNMRVAAFKHEDGGREDVPQFSMRAVFEAITNAVAHRDYSMSGSKVRLRLFRDRLEIYSPGMLPNTMTTESLALRQAARNEAITSLLARCPIQDSALAAHRQHIMDKRGEGVPVILAETERLSGMRPRYQLLDESELLLTIPAADPARSES